MVWHHSPWWIWKIPIGIFPSGYDQHTKHPIHWITTWYAPLLYTFLCLPSMHIFVSFSYLVITVSTNYAPTNKLPILYILTSGKIYSFTPTVLQGFHQTTIKLHSHHPMLFKFITRPKQYTSTFLGVAALSSTCLP